VIEREKPAEAKNGMGPGGLVSSPRAYFGRASRAATGALRAGISEVSESGAAADPGRRPVYRAGDPALRLFAGLTLPFAPTAPLTGAIATLSGLRDGEHEKLFIDLGASLVRATRRRDEKGGTLSLILARTQSALTYGALLASLRYVNDAAAPADGVRRIALQTIDAGGRTKDVAAALFAVGNAELETELLLAAADEQLILGEKQSFNSDGDYTLFWWPRFLPGAAGRARRAQAGEPEPDAAGPAGSFFSGGGRLYRLFDPEPARAGAPDPIAANDRAAPRRGAGDGVWVPGRGLPPPGFARARMLRLEDIFGSDMQDAIARRLIEQRLAAGR
jgi:hypothetical protein